MVEWRDVRGTHFRASQQPAVVPFEDGTVLSFSGSQVALRAEEWFTVRQVIEVFVAFSESRPFPNYVIWSDISDIIAAGR